MQKQGNGKQKSKSIKLQEPRLTLLDLKEIYFQSGQEQVSVEEATDAQFDAFIRHCIDVGWSLEERRDALNLALEKGTLALPARDEESEKNQSENQKKIKDDLISDTDESAQEAVPQEIA